MNTPLQVLMVEDSEDDALLVLDELRRAGFDPVAERVESAEAMRAALARRPWQVVIADYSLPHFSGLEAILLLRECGLDVPIVVVSGAIGEETAVAAMKAGASDYVMKHNLVRLGPVVQRELREAENRRQRNEMEARLRAAERLQIIGQLVLGVAHEVRNPLNCINVVSEALYEELGKNPTYKSYLDYIREQVVRLADLVSDLLDMGKPLDPARMHRDSLVSICSAALALWRESRPQQTHPVTLITPPTSGGLEVMADGARLQQVIINLVDNAAQNSPDGSEIRIEVVGPENGLLRVRVTDRGRGIAPEDVHRLFEPFFTTRKGGTGLGLCIVQRVVKDHGGDVELRNNEPPPGCTVEARLPQAE